MMLLYTKLLQDCGFFINGINLAVNTSVFAASPPRVDTSAAAVTQIWVHVGELVFNMLVPVGYVKMRDRIIREVIGL